MICRFCKSEFNPEKLTKGAKTCCIASVYIKVCSKEALKEMIGYLNKGLEKGD